MESSFPDQQSDSDSSATVDETALVDMLETIDRWDGDDLTALKEIGRMIQEAYNEDNHVAVRQCCERMLGKPIDLPLLCKAKIFAWLGACPDYNDWAMLTIAKPFIQQAKATMRDVAG